MLASNPETCFFATRMEGWPKALESGHFSVTRSYRQWYVACRSRELTARPKAVEILGLPIVLFRTPQGPAALLDRCAHRNVPLSLGRTVDGHIECAYHGWQFGADGVCAHVPALCGPQEGKARRVPSLPVREQQDLIWVYMEPGEGAGAPPRLPCKGDPAYTHVDQNMDFSATLHATLENILDVPHTAFLHRGLFRTAKRNAIRAIVRRQSDRVEAQYVGEPRPGGVLGKILAPGGGEIEHYDRFILPSVAQVEYRLGKSHLFINSILTPLDDFRTRMFATVSVRLPFGGSVVREVLAPFAMKVLKQDAVILAEQTRLIRRFGGEQYVSTPVDVLGPHILRLLRQAERGDLPQTSEAHEETVEMLA